MPAVDFMFVIAVGNAFDGIKITGPFGSHDEALEFAETHIQDAWEIIELIPSSDMI